MKRLSMTRQDDAATPSSRVRYVWKLISVEQKVNEVCELTFESPLNVTVLLTCVHITLTLVGQVCIW